MATPLDRRGLAGLLRLARVHATGTRPVLVGEDNPHGSDPCKALFPYPANSAGARLCSRVLGLDPLEYLTRFDRVNLCVGKWSIREARERAASIAVLGTTPVAGARQTLILLGAKVCTAFAVEYAPFTARTLRVVSTDSAGFDLHVVILPHPSGRCLMWNEPSAYERARSVLRAAGVL